MILFRGPFWIAVELYDEKVRAIDFSFFREPPDWEESEKAKQIFFDYLYGNTSKVDWGMFKPLEREIYKLVCQIPFGKTMSYGEIGRLSGIHPRVVGRILGKNPIPLLIPCHRVVGKKSLGGFSKGVEEKAALLSFESWFLSFFNPSF